MSPSELAFRVRCARDDLKHNCAAKLNCPLKLQLDQLIREIDLCYGGCETLTLESVMEEEGEGIPNKGTALHQED